MRCSISSVIKSVRNVGAWNANGMVNSQSRIVSVLMRFREVVSMLDEQFRRNNVRSPLPPPTHCRAAGAPGGSAL